MTTRRTCPSCGETLGIPLGGAGFAWWECPCGSYSPPGSTWEAAYLSWSKEPLFLDPEIVCYPPVGCPDAQEVWA